MKSWLLPVYALCGLVACIWIAPKTGWIVRQQAGIITDTTFKPGVAGDAERSPAGLYPQAGEKLSGDPELLEEVVDFEAVAGSDNERPAAVLSALRRVYDLCARQSSAVYWAEFVRVGFLSTSFSDPRQPSRQDPDRRAALALLIKGCQNGAALEPSNGFFPAFESAARLRQGDTGGALTMLRSAAAASTWEDSISWELAVGYRWRLARFGYQGSQIRLWLWNAEIYPNYSCLRATCGFFARTGDLNTRVAVLELGGLMIRRSDSVIGILIGRGLVASALSPLSSHPLKAGKGGTASSLEQLEVLARPLEAVNPQSSQVEQIVRDYFQLNTLGLDFGNADAVQRLSGNGRLLWSGWALLAVILSPIGIATCLAKNASIRFGAASPYLIWLLALGAIREGVTPAIPAILAVLFFPALVDRWRGRVDQAGYGLGAVILVVAIALQLLVPALAAALFLASLCIERRLNRLPAFVTEAALVIVIAVISAFWVIGVYFHGLERALIPSAGVAIGLLAVVPVRRPLRWEPLAGIVCLLFGAVYAASIYRAVSDDRELSQILDLWDHQAVRLRLDHDIR